MLHGSMLMTDDRMFGMTYDFIIFESKLPRQGKNFCKLPGELYWIVTTQKDLVDWKLSPELL